MQAEPREQREQCQTCLSIAESRPRSMSINAIKFTWIAEAPPELAVWLKITLQRYGDYFIPTIPLIRHSHTTFMVYCYKSHHFLLVFLWFHSFLSEFRAKMLKQWQMTVSIFDEFCFTIIYNIYIIYIVTEISILFWKLSSVICHRPQKTAKTDFV